MILNPRTTPSPTRLRQQLSELERTDRYWINRYHELLASTGLAPLTGQLTGSRCAAHVQHFEWQQKNRELRLSVKTETTC